MGQVKVYEDLSAKMQHVICMDIRGDVRWEDILRARADIILIISREPNRRFDLVVNRKHHSGTDADQIAGLSNLKPSSLPCGGSVVVVGDHFMSVWAHQLNRYYQLHPVLYTVPSMQEAYDVIRLSRAEKQIPLDYCAPRRG